MWTFGLGKYLWTVLPMPWKQGAGIVIITPEGIWVEHSFRLDFKASKNKVEYEAFLIGMRAILDLEAQEVEVYSDS